MTNEDGFDDIDSDRYDAETTLAPLFVALVAGLFVGWVIMLAVTYPR